MKIQHSTGGKSSFYFFFFFLNSTFLHLCSFSEINKAKPIIFNAYFGANKREISILMLQLKIFTVRKATLIIFHLCILKQWIWSGNILMSCSRMTQLLTGQHERELITWRALFYSSAPCKHFKKKKNFYLKGDSVQFN